MSILRSRTRSAGRRDFEVPDGSAHSVGFRRLHHLLRSKTWAVESTWKEVAHHACRGHTLKRPGRTSVARRDRKPERSCNGASGVPSLSLGGRCDGCRNPSWLRTAWPSEGVRGGSSGGSTQDGFETPGRSPRISNVGGPVTEGPKRSPERRNPMRGGTLSALQ